MVLEGTNYDTLRYVNLGTIIQEIHRRKPFARQSNRVVKNSRNKKKFEEEAFRFLGMGFLVYAEIFPKFVGPCLQGGVWHIGNFIYKSEI